MMEWEKVGPREIEARSFEIITEELGILTTRTICASRREW